VEVINVPGDAEFMRLVQELSAGLVARGWQMAAAESCTGGWIAKCCTDQAGSSGWFERGFVTYSDASKQGLLGVEASTLHSAGAVSREVALQMAEGARLKAGVDVAVAVTGIAGPEGGTPQKPVGTVWFAWSLARQSEAEMIRFTGERDAVRRQTVAHALKGLVDRVRS
jgi:nicotinamide-nucleotide amidase